VKIVSIELFDAQGRRVRTITNEQYSKGYHEITIERGSLSAGIYFCKMVNGKNKSTRQMTVIN
jgi:flagellar hook assembly protein FlgD